MGTDLDIKRSLNEYYIGRIGPTITDAQAAIDMTGACFPFRSKWGFNAYLTAQNIEETNRIFGSVFTGGQCLYSDGTKMYALAPLPDSMFQTMGTGRFTISPNDPTLLREVFVKAEDGTTYGSYIQCLANTANTPYTISSTYALHAKAPFVLEVRHYPQLLAGQTDTALFTFTFGGGHTLQWGRSPFIVFTTSAGVTHVKTLDPGTQQELYAAEKVVWEVYSIGSDLHLVCHLLGGEAWVIPNIGALPQAGYSLAYNAGSFMCNCSELVFGETGTVDTDWIDHFNQYAQADGICGAFPNVSGIIDPPNKALGTPFTVPNGTVTVAVLAETNDLGTLATAVNGRYKRYRITLARAAGDANKHSTPYVEALQITCPPVHEAADPDWLNISAYVGKHDDDGSQATETRSESDHSTCTLNIDLQKEIDGLTFREYVAAFDPTLLQGSIAFQYKKGTATGAGVLTQIDGFTGRITVGDDLNKLGQGTKDWQCTAIASTELLGDELYFAPAVFPFTLPDAITWTCRFAGYDVSQIDVSDLPVTGYSDPIRDYANPPWLPSMGVTGKDFLDELCHLKGIHYRDDNAGGLVFARNALAVATLTATITQERGVDVGDAMSDGSAHRDLAASENMLLVIGQDDRKRPVLGYDGDSNCWNLPGYRGYRGRKRIKVLRNENVQTAGQARADAINAYRDQRFPLRTFTVSSPGAWGWDWQEWDLICLVLAADVVTPWADATDYATADGYVINSLGAAYHCTAAHTASTATEPGIGVDWATVWEVYAGQQLTPVYCRVSGITTELTAVLNPSTVTLRELRNINTNTYE